MFKRCIAVALTASLLGTGDLQGQLQSGNTNRFCLLTDIFATGMTVTGCSGFWSGNVLSGNSGDVAIQNTELNALLGTTGVDYWGTKIESQSQALGNFSTMLYGITAIGIHWGNGANVFSGNPDYSGKGGGTAFYVFDAGTTGIDVFQFASRVNSAQSTGIVYRTDTPVPEPSSVALIVAGLVGIAAASRRRLAIG